ncbi:MAG: cupin-like domain-containing protein [Rhizobacter sp.]|nr:cupin-like domain-containing protein [Bacteriovorax sp.]
MKNLKCFAGDINPNDLDRKPFGFHHNLADHPALSIDNISKIIQELPKEKVMFSKGLNNLKVNFDHALNNDTKKLDLKEVIETLRTSNSYIAARNLELHPSFKGLYDDLLSDIAELMQRNGTGTKVLEPMVWLFIASPNAVTPFHFDRSSNFIMQIRGSKQLAVFPPRVEEVISAKDTESYVDWSSELPPWREEIDLYANKFNFKSGEAVHIPFVSGHYVKNGPEDISITMSFFFHSDETFNWAQAMKMNNRLRRLGVKPSAIGVSPVVDSLKAGIFPAVDGVFNVARKLRGN